MVANICSSHSCCLVCCQPHRHRCACNLPSRGCACCFCRQCRRDAGLYFMLTVSRMVLLFDCRSVSALSACGSLHMGVCPALVRCSSCSSTCSAVLCCACLVHELQHWQPDTCVYPVTESVRYPPILNSIGPFVAIGSAFTVDAASPAASLLRHACYLDEGVARIVQ
jgi:hypothetical protein